MLSTKPNPILSILFVCYGNICRSPMAAGLAPKLLPRNIYVESAGISPSSSRATPEAIEIMEADSDIDISSHHPRNVGELALDNFDYIIALDRYVYEYLKVNFQIASNKLIWWNIADPYFQGSAAYISCLREIKLHLQELNSFISAKASIK
jgi:protein-tyrosine phosphatase